MRYDGRRKEKERKQRRNGPYRTLGGNVRFSADLEHYCVTQMSQLPSILEK